MPDASAAGLAGAPPGPRRAPLPPVIHHIAVQTTDLEASLAWYRDFFGASVSWTLDSFSELSLSRLPGLSRLAEVTVGGLRFHLFTRGAEHGGPPPAGTHQFQHVCLEVGGAEELTAWHARWFAVHASGAHRFTRDEPATDIVVDGDGVRSFYAYDVNGVEFEFTWIPGDPPAAPGL
ncbi:VOC family protein [Streptomyces sp. NPDC014894]|uniref:VOC family protein n=1 Tax=Streptomyces sp. NPDC014894 TaxID=3364931 RepID=UPI003701B71E